MRKKILNLSLALIGLCLFSCKTFHNEVNIFRDSENIYFEVEYWRPFKLFECKIVPLYPDRIEYFSYADKIYFDSKDDTKQIIDMKSVYSFNTDFVTKPITNTVYSIHIQGSYGREYFGNFLFINMEDICYPTKVEYSNSSHILFIPNSQEDHISTGIHLTLNKDNIRFQIIEDEALRIKNVKISTLSPSDNPIEIFKSIHSSFSSRNPGVNTNDLHNTPIQFYTNTVYQIVLETTKRKYSKYFVIPYPVNGYVSEFGNDIPWVFGNVEIMDTVVSTN